MYSVLCIVYVYVYMYALCIVFDSHLWILWFQQIADFGLTMPVDECGMGSVPEGEGTVDYMVCMGYVYVYVCVVVYVCVYMCMCSDTNLPLC